MKNILIVGGAGFIGSNITAKLADKGYNVTIFDSLSSQVHGKRNKSSLFSSVKNIADVIIGDVCNKDDWGDILSDKDAVIY